LAEIDLIEPAVYWRRFAMRTYILVLMTFGGVAACGDDLAGDGTSGLFAQISQTSSEHVGEGLVHESTTATAFNSSTECSEWDETLEESELREKFSVRAEGICRTPDGGGTECLSAQTFSGGSLLYRIGDNAETAPDRRGANALLSFESDGVRHAFSFVGIGARTFWFIQTVNGRESCVPGASATYGPNDAVGTFALTALMVGNDLELREVATDTVSCSLNGCTSTSGSIALSLPDEAFNESFQGYTSATASIDGELYGQVLGSFSPQHDYASFLACPTSVGTYDFASECLFILAERI
jgi:hypothetical protein